MRASREEWSKRVARWQDSGLTAEQFATEVGINAATLKFWKYKLGKRAEAAPSSKPHALRLVELRPAKRRAEAPLELELAGGRCIRVPAGFDADSLKRLIAVLETT